MSNKPPSDKEDPIDAVVAWVDGNDPLLRERREAALRELSDSNAFSGILPAGKDNTRFTDSGEVRWCLHSIRRFAPWIRTIHLVTDQQRPAFLTLEQRKVLGVRVVDHREIFRGYEWALPTFNNRVIETALWRIPGLSERFLYLNDDFMILAPVVPGDFFLPDGVVCRGRWRRMKNFGFARRWANHLLNFGLKRFLGMTRTMHLAQQMKSARLAGMRGSYYRITHAPHPLRRATLETFFKHHPDLFEENIRYPFRSIHQFSAIFLAYHLEIREQKAELRGEEETLMISADHPRWPSIEKRLKRIREGKIRFLCVQGFEKFAESERRLVEKLVAACVNGQQGLRGE